jgi:hypothetical protein
MESINSNRGINIGTPSTRERHLIGDTVTSNRKAMRSFRLDPTGKKTGRRREDAERTKQNSLPHLQPKPHYCLAPTRIIRRMNKIASWPNPARLGSKCPTTLGWRHHDGRTRPARQHLH